MYFFRRAVLLILIIFFNFACKAQSNFLRMKLQNDSVYLYPFPYYSWSYNSNPEIVTGKEYSYGATEGLFLTTLHLPDGKWMAYYKRKHG
jgi:hypothetical protein